jgi:uncharacterized metal-binding protein
MNNRHISGVRRCYYLAILSHCFLAFGFAIASLISLPDSLAISLCLGMFFGGHFLSPDLAFSNSFTSASWGFLSHIWQPYRTWARSHLRTNNAFILGLTIRLIYFYICVQLFIGTIYALAINFGFNVPTPEFIRTFALETTRDRWLEIEVAWVGAVLGCNPFMLIIPFEMLVKIVNLVNNLKLFKK